MSFDFGSDSKKEKWTTSFASFFESLPKSKLVVHFYFFTQLG
jgi:hypothetical protein